MPTTARQLRTKLTIERRANTPDDMSEEKPKWIQMGILWAQIKAASGDERFDSGQMKSIIGYKIITRYHADLKPTDRLRDNVTDVLYNIDAITNEMQQRRFLNITATVSDDGNS